MNDVCQAALDRLRPSDAERQQLDATVTALLERMQTAVDATGLRARVTVQGSVAKDTWIAGTADVDMFLLFDPDVAADAMAAAAKQAAHQVLDDAKERYAQHPYIVGAFDGLEVDCVPAYQVADASAKMSAVDRTPFHTAWVRDHLSDDLRDDVRLAKQWMKGVGIYGAETAIAGFSGYLVEVLVIGLQGFSPLLAWLAEGAPAQEGLCSRSPGPEVLQIPDPVDAGRNCAAAVAQATLDLAREAALEFEAAPRPEFFFPAAPRAETPGVLRDHLGEQQQWLGWYFPHVDARLDIIYPQFQKAGARIEAALEQAGFHVLRRHAWTEGDAVGLQWLLPAELLPASKLHRGPRPEATPNADKFLEKWVDHPDALGPAEPVDGRLQVEVAQRRRHAIQWLQDLVQAPDIGKHVTKAAKQALVLDDVEGVPSLWSPAVADFILDRRAWQR